MSAVTGKPMPKRRHVDLGSAIAAVTPIATKIISSEGGAASTDVFSSTDIIFEILSRLPVKTLCRFRCASKQWHYVVSDPTFIAAHESRADPLLVGTVRGGEFLRLMDMEGNVVRSMDGVVGCWMLCSGLDDLLCFTNDQYPNIQVIDLATGEMLLTRSDLDQGVQRLDYTRYTFGFGRTALSYGYKVFRLKEDLGSDDIGQTCEVLTLGDSSGWRKTKEPDTVIPYQSSVAINGVLYFLVLHENNILCFDLESESWNKKVECPGEVNYLDLWANTRNVNIAELNNALCMVQTKAHSSGYLYTDIWLLNYSNNIWSKTYTIRMDRPVDLVKPLRIMCDGGKLLFYYMKDNITSTIQIYDPRDDAYTDMIETTTSLIAPIVLCNLRLSRFFSGSLSLV